jgi:hypothetical protein
MGPMRFAHTAEVRDVGHGQTHSAVDRDLVNEEVGATVGSHSDAEPEDAAGRDGRAHREHEDTEQ